MPGKGRQLSGFPLRLPGINPLILNFPLLLNLLQDDPEPVAGRISYNRTENPAAAGRF